MVDIGNEPHPELKARGVPFVMDMLPDGDNKRALHLLLSPQEYGRPFGAPAGIPADRLRIVSYGKEFPFDPGHDESAYSKNRRAHFVITAK